MNKNIIYYHGVAWMNPYTQPPNNLPRRLLNVRSTQHRATLKLKSKIDRILDRLRDNGITGYCQTWSYETIKTRQWSEEAKQRNRLKRLRTRLQKQFSIPQMLEEEVNKAINRKPEYYGL